MDRPSNQPPYRPNTTATFDEQLMGLATHLRVHGGGLGGDLAERVEACASYLREMHHATGGLGDMLETIMLNADSALEVAMAWTGYDNTATGS